MYYAKVILDSVGLYNARITTFEVCAPRFLLAEINTHRVLAKSAASSRAIPVKKRIEMVETSPFIPETFGKNKAGMQANETLSADDSDAARTIWQRAINSAIADAKELSDIGVHKQQANRLLEPFCFYTGVITATEWDNFYSLRLHPDAQPEFQKLAKLMKESHDSSNPVFCNQHLPYADDLVENFGLNTALNVSAARCARVSYKTFDGKISEVGADFKLCDDLIKGGHMSPFDHQATADSTIFDPSSDNNYWSNPDDHRQYWGWIPYRVNIEKQLGLPPGRRNSYAPIQ